jgi:hypothetical protein
MQQQSMPLVTTDQTLARITTSTTQGGRERTGKIRLLLIQQIKIRGYLKAQLTAILSELSQRWLGM